MKRRKILTGFKTYSQAAEALNVTEAEARKIARELYKANTRLRSLQQKQKDVALPSVKSLKTFAKLNKYKSYEKQLEVIQDIQKAPIVLRAGQKFLKTKDFKINNIPQLSTPQKAKEYRKAIEKNKIKQMAKSDKQWVQNYIKANEDVGNFKIAEFFRNITTEQAVRWLRTKSMETIIYVIYKDSQEEEARLEEIKSQLKDLIKHKV